MDLGIFPILDNEDYVEQKHILLPSIIDNATKDFSKSINLKFNRIYVGSEFCERLFPSPKKLLRILRGAEELNLKTSLVTPAMLTETGAKQFQYIFNKLRNKNRLEIIVNCWGMLELLRDYKNLEPVFGRSLNKIKRDPRWRGDSSALKQSSLSISSFTNLLKKYRVRKIELDNVPQGLIINSNGDELQYHLYFSKIPISFSKICVFGSTNIKGRKFSIDSPCQKECQDYSIIYRDEAGKTTEHIGRAVYMENKNLDKINLKRISRLIFSF